MKHFGEINANPGENRNICGQATRTEDVAYITIAWLEIPLRQQVKRHGGRCNPQHGHWEIRYEQVVALGLQSRIIDSEDLSGL